ncbi:hypothetical protein, partial [Microcoleus sp. T3_D1]|uniref:hypothetical protein n=1 Tax=Microcoleus sp. T3_D1 TaxID=3055427 RepID=UPI002FD5C34A
GTANPYSPQESSSNCATRVNPPHPYLIIIAIGLDINYQPGSPSVYLKGINLSAARSTPLGITPA